MGFNDFNGMIGSVFAGAKEARKDNYEKKFADLNKTWNHWPFGSSSTPLVGVDELTDLMNHAKTKEQYEAILDHMYRHDATRVKPYKKIEDNIIKHFWED